MDTRSAASHPPSTDQVVSIPGNGGKKKSKEEKKKSKVNPVTFSSIR